MSDRTCSLEGCPQPTYCRGYCKRHYEQIRTGRRLTLEYPATSISYMECAYCGGLFVRGGGRYNRSALFCSPTCRNKARTVEPATKSYWSGWRHFVFRPDHPNANCRGYMALHRLVLSEKLGRPLRDDEDAHHLNHDNQDNRPENLVPMSRSEHSRTHGPPHARKEPPCTS